jgi:hypothetical protein
LAKDIWQFSDPDGNGSPEPTTPPEITLQSFLAKHGISKPTPTPAPTPAPSAISVTDLNPTQLFEYKKEDQK